MKKVELLSPAGDYNCLVAAIQAGCDALYMGGKNFGARSFANNFSPEEIIKSINYAHLYGVKVYITVNTLIYDNEIDEFMNYIDFLHKNNVDAIIIQDLGMLDLVRKTYPNLEIHASTQMHIHNLDGVLMVKKLGVNRVVLARETSIKTIKKIKEMIDMPLEIFIHGALCLSYSGQCLMSSLIGGRSGNRGSCAGSCRQKYDVIDEYDHVLNNNSYPLSTKDLCSLEDLEKLLEMNIDSLKIEGRMKSASYVYCVTKLYREAIDSYYETGKVSINEELLINLKKIFNRTWTKGFLNDTLNDDIVNPYRPNHLGLKIGTIKKFKNSFVDIELCDELNIGDGLRIVSNNDDIGILVNEFYINRVLVKKANKGDIISLKVMKKVNIGDEVLITSPKKIIDEIGKIILSNERKVLININIELKVNKPIILNVSDEKNSIRIMGDIVLKSIDKPIKKEDILEKLSKTGGTIYKINNISIDMDDDVFISWTVLNELRRKSLEELSNKRLYRTIYQKREYKINLIDFSKEKKKTKLIENLICDINNEYNEIYSYDNGIIKYPRVCDSYKLSNDLSLVSEIGALNKLKNVYTDFSFNVLNAYSVALLHSLGVKKITLSYELNEEQIKNLIDNYHNTFNKHPNLELIVYGYQEVMVSKFSLNKYYKTNKKIFLRDRFNNKYFILERNNYMYIYNYKLLNIYDEKYYNMGINSLRFNI